MWVILRSARYFGKVLVEERIDKYNDNDEAITKSIGNGDKFSIKLINSKPLKKQQPGFIIV